MRMKKKDNFTIHSENFSSCNHCIGTIDYSELITYNELHVNIFDIG